MVVDATDPTLVLLAVVVAAIVAARLGRLVLTRARRAVRAAGTRPAALVTERWCPRVVLIDDDRRTAAA